MCRVFHKSKGSSENNSTEVSSQQLASSPPSDHHHHQNMGNNYGSYDQMTSFSSTPTNHSPSGMMINHRLHDFSSNPTMIGTSTTVTNTEISSRNCSNDDYGFLWDMNFDQENSLENHHAMPSNFDEMRPFELDNGMVFL